MNIDWNKAPVWANAVISSKNGNEYYVSQFGGISARQRVGHSEVDDNASADMIIPHEWTLVATRPSPWLGEGRPPVGLEVEVVHGNSDQGTGIVLFYGEQRCIIKNTTEGAEREQTGAIEDYIFRPIRTPQQIEEEKRDNAAAEMAEATQGAKDWPDAFRMLHNAGYRKQVEP